MVETLGTTAVQADVVCGPAGAEVLAAGAEFADEIGEAAVVGISAGFGVRAGDTVWTPPGEEHWHGGTNRTTLCHIAMLDAPDDSGADGTTWLEPVTDEQFTAAHQH